jgi:hypothetical protein
MGKRRLNMIVHDALQALQYIRTNKKCLNVVKWGSRFLYLGIPIEFSLHGKSMPQMHN